MSSHASPKLAGGIAIFVSGFELPPSEYSMMYGHSFNGRYIDPDSGFKFDSNSPTIEIDGVSANNTFRFFKRLNDNFDALTILVKDLENGMIYKLKQH